MNKTPGKLTKYELITSKENIFKKNLLENFEENLKSKNVNKISLINQKLHQMWGEIENSCQISDMDKENSSLKMNENNEIREVFLIINCFFKNFLAKQRK